METSSIIGNMKEGKGEVKREDFRQHISFFRNEDSHMLQGWFMYFCACCYFSGVRRPSSGEDELKAVGRKDCEARGAYDDRDDKGLLSWSPLS